MLEEGGCKDWFVLDLIVELLIVVVFGLVVFVVIELWCKELFINLWLFG